MDLDVERETVVRFGVPVVATLVFVGLVAVVGVLFGTAPGTAPAGNGTATATPGTPGATTAAGVELTATGAFALVGLLAVFVVGMAILGAAVGGES